MSIQINKKLIKEIQKYIDERYVEDCCGNFTEKIHMISIGKEKTTGLSFNEIIKPMRVSDAKMAYPSASVKEPVEAMEKPGLFTSDKMDLSSELPLEVLLDQVDESFTEMLFRKIDEKGIKDSDCYKKANISRQLFSKIRKDMDYRPRKNTIIALAAALELDLNETKDMLLKAGFALSHSSKFDIIIEFFIRNQKYDVSEINQALSAFDQSLLGA